MNLCVLNGQSQAERKRTTDTLEKIAVDTGEAYEMVRLSTLKM